MIETLELTTDYTDGHGQRSCRQDPTHTEPHRSGEIKWSRQS